MHLIQIFLCRRQSRCVPGEVVKDKQDIPWLESSEELAGWVDSAGGEGGAGSDRCVLEEVQASCGQGDLQGGLLDDLGVLGEAAYP